MHTANAQKSPKIGIMADSHGQEACLQEALTFFERQGCDNVYHLGDICDSAHPETADTCVQLLQQHQVLAIKGNNDHQVAINHMGIPAAYITAATIEALKALPLTREIDEIVLAHSLPFIEQRGLSSMVGTLGKDEAVLFFRIYPHKILIRGHSHLPELVQSDKDNIVSTKLTPGKFQQLSDVVPGIITCGAVDHGYVMIWDRRAQTICSCKI